MWRNIEHIYIKKLGTVAYESWSRHHALKLLIRHFSILEMFTLRFIGLTFTFLFLSFH